MMGLSHAKGGVSYRRVNPREWRKMYVPGNSAEDEMSVKPLLGAWHVRIWAKKMSLMFLGAAFARRFGQSSGSWGVGNEVPTTQPREGEGKWGQRSAHWWTVQMVQKLCLVLVGINDGQDSCVQPWLCHLGLSSRPMQDLFVWRWRGCVCAAATSPWTILSRSSEIRFSSKRKSLVSLVGRPSLQVILHKTGNDIQAWGQGVDYWFHNCHPLLTLTTGHWCVVEATTLSDHRCIEFRCTKNSIRGNHP